LLLVSLLVRLHIVEGLQYSLHQMVLSDQLLEIDGVVACWVGHYTGCSLCSPSNRLIGHGYKIL
jgi:hypothetical protein